MALEDTEIAARQASPLGLRAGRFEALLRACAYAFERLESRLLLSTTAINPNEAVPFQQIVIDPNPGSTPVVKQLVDITNDGKEDAVIGHETTLGGGGLDWYQFPASGNPNDPWTEHVIDAKADVYEEIRAANISGNVDSHGNPVNDLVVCERGTIYWYENPLGLGESPATAPWPKFLIGTVTQGTTHELYLADLDGAGPLDVISNTVIFFPNYTAGQSAPTSWTRLANPAYNRTEKGLYLFDSGSGLGSIDLLGTGNAPNFQVGWYENPRDTGGNARTGTWVFHAIGPAYGNYVTGDGISYAAMDVNGDGREDIITCDGENGENPPYLTGGLIWWEAPVNRATGTWTEHVIDASITDVHNLVLADMSGDGQEDILAFEQDQSPQGRLMIIYNEGGTGQNWLEQTIASDAMPGLDGGEGGHNESVGDATGDGALDILTSPHGFYTGVNPISLWLNEIPSEGIVTPTVTGNPVSQSVAAGGSVTFSVTATGTGPLVYQWEENGLDVSGANSASFTLSSVPASDNGMVVRCIVGNKAGLIPSAGATLTIGTGPTLPTAALTQPTTISAANTSETLQVVYADTNGIEASTLKTGNLQVTGPLGFSQAATFESVTPSGNGQSLTATYSVTPPTGGWTTTSSGTYTVALAANSVSDTMGNFAAAANLGTFTVTIVEPGSLVGSQATPAAGYNLTSLGTSDWAHWGRGGTYGNFDHKATGGSQISNVTVVGSGNVGGYTDTSRSVSWRDGSPTATDRGDDGYIWSNNVLDAGFSFTVPADTTTRTLYVYAGGYQSGATITAQLSDGSAANYVASASGSESYTQLYTITYHAGSAGQHLTVSYLRTQNIDAGGSADLIAAALVQLAPPARSPSPPVPPKVPVVVTPLLTPAVVPVVVPPVVASPNVSTIDPSALGANTLMILGHEEALTVSMFG